MNTKLLKKALAFVGAATLVLGMSTTIYAAEDDIVLNDAGSPFIREIDPGDGSDYTYMGYVYCGENVTSDYKYLQMTYTGDENALSSLRLELLANDGSDTGLGVFWFSQNDEGSFKTADGELLSAPSATEQTAYIDLVASGIDISNGIKAFHIHDTKGTGKLVISDARFVKALPQSSEEVEEEDKAPEKEEASKDEEASESEENSTPATEEENVPKMGDTDTSMYWILLGAGVVALAGTAIKVTRKNRA